MKKILKYLFYTVFCNLVLLIRADMLLRTLSKNRRLILMFHGVSRKSHFGFNGRHLPNSQFERLLIYFKKHFNVVSLEALCADYPETNTSASHSIALTFDDGFLNNVDVALPFLVKHKIPATFFVCTSGLNDKKHLHPDDLLDMIRVSCPDPEIVINGRSFSKSNHHLLDKITGENAYAYVNSLTYPEWKMTIQELSRKYLTNALIEGIDNEVYSLMKEENIRMASAISGISIGSHAHEHVNLTTLTAGEIHDQLITSKEKLEKITGKPVPALAFPNGQFNETVLLETDKTTYTCLLGAGDIAKKYKNRVFPRIGILSGASYAYSVLSVNKGFERFGF